MQSPQQSNEPRKRTRTRGGRKHREKMLQQNLEQNCKKEGMLFGNLDPVPYDRNVDAPPGACLNCRSFRHKHKDCMNPKTHEYCCNCGRRGVAVDQCPRCARSFQAQDRVMKSWVYYKFFDDEFDCEKEVLEKKESRENERDCHGKIVAVNNKLFDDEPGWEKEVLEKKESRENERDCHGNVTAANNKMKESHQSNENVYVESRDGEPTDNLDESRMDSFVENLIATKTKKEPSTSEPLRDWLRFFDKIKHLSVEAQNIVVLQFAAERMKMTNEKEAQLGITSEM